MYIERVRSKGRCYLYLKKYDGRIMFGTKKKTLYRFGRLENALNEMKIWLEDMNCLPLALQELGCSEENLIEWINSIERQKKEPLYAFFNYRFIKKSPF